MKLTVSREEANIIAKNIRNIIADVGAVKLEELGIYTDCSDFVVTWGERNKSESIGQTSTGPAFISTIEADINTLEINDEVLEHLGNVFEKAISEYIKKLTIEWVDDLREAIRKVEKRFKIESSDSIECYLDSNSKTKSIVEAYNKLNDTQKRKARARIRKVVLATGWAVTDDEAMRIISHS